MAHLIIPTSNFLLEKTPLLGDDDKGLRIFIIILLKFSFWAQMKIKKSFKYKEMLIFCKKSRGQSPKWKKSSNSKEREREPLKYYILLDNWCEINKLGGKKKPKLYIGTWALG